VSIDARIGAIAFPGYPLGPGTSRTQFLASPLAVGETVVVANDPWWTYGLPPQTLGRRAFAAMVSYKGESLRAVYLTDTDSRFGTSWDDWSEEKEQDRKRQHDRWLQAILGRGCPWKFSWGAIDSCYDPRASSSSIGIDYRGR
jgi:hypothetical protein